MEIGRKAQSKKWWGWNINNWVDAMQDET
jgi:hypothetical protein